MQEQEHVAGHMQGCCSLHVFSGRRLAVCPKRTQGEILSPSSPTAPDIPSPAHALSDAQPRHTRWQRGRTKGTQLRGIHEQVLLGTGGGLRGLQGGWMVMMMEWHGRRQGGVAGPHEEIIQVSQHRS